MATHQWKEMVDRDDVDFRHRKIDVKILELLEEGRCTRRHLASQLGVTGEYVYQRVDLMVQFGLIRVIHDGFYELAEDSGGLDLDDVDGGVASEAGTVGVDIEARVEAVDWSESNYARTTSRVRALVRAFEHLREHGTAKTPELVAILDEQLGDDGNNQRLLSDIAKELKIVESPPAGSNKYTWLGSEE